MQVTESEQEAVQSQQARPPHEQATVSELDILEHHQRCLEDKQKEGRVPEEIQDEGVEFEV